MANSVNPTVAGDLSTLYGKKIVRAESSLQNFSVEVEGATGLNLQALNQSGRMFLSASVVDSSGLPKLSEAVCSVDWSWIYGSVVREIIVSTGTVRLNLEPVGPVNISLSVWQGSPFLSFQPFRPSHKS